jgi:ribosome-associated toxin RatA of RatAB toxin-antitoxin module
LNIIRQQLRVPYRAEDLYNLVADIKTYPEFLPWCKQAHILKDLDKIVEARLTLNKSGISKNFSTRNVMTPYEKIEMHLLEGPLKHLYGIWTFLEDNQGCLVTLKIEFSFDSKIMALMLEPIFKSVAENLLAAFVKRAEEKCQRV